MNKSVYITAPVYNIDKKYLKKMVKSLIKQTYDNWKLIIVDDGSKKDTADYLDYLATLDKRISVIHQRNTGCVGARRTGFRAMKGADYVTTVDSDDYLPYNALEIMVTAAEKHRADLVVGEAKRVLGRIEIPHKPGAYFHEEKVYSNKEIIDDLLISYFGWNKIPVAVWGKLYDKKFLPILAEGEVVNVFTATDANASLNVIPFSQKLVTVCEPVYCYRFGGGTSKFRPDYFEETLNWYKYRLLFIEKYLSNFSAKGVSAYDLLAEELKNETHFHLKRFITSTHPKDEDIIKIVESYYEIPEVVEAFENHAVNQAYNEYSEYMKKKESSKVLELLKKEVQKEMKKSRIKNFVMKLLEKV